MTQPFDNRDWDVRQIAELEKKIEDQQILLIRAATALENIMPALMDGSVLKITSVALIDELRRSIHGQRRS